MQRIARIVASGLLLALLAAPAVALETFSAPAGTRPAGPSSVAPFAGILPSGRILAPVGTSVPVGMNALGVALAPGGRYAIVSNSSERELTAHNARDPRVVGAFSLTVVDTKTMRVASVYPADTGEAFFVGVVALRDPANAAKTVVLASEGPTNVVRVFDLSAAGVLTPEATPIAVPGPIDEKFADQNHAFPATIALSQNHKVAYVVNELANSVSAIDVTHRQLLRTVRVGFFPFGVAVAGKTIAVTDEGLMRYANLPAPVRVPAFANTAPQPDRASSLSLVPVAPNGDLSGTATPLEMDRPPDGTHAVGGAHPNAIATTPDGKYAYVAMANVDRIATVALGGTPRVIGGLQLRLFDKAPYGTQPSGIALSADGKVMYVALAGINAVALVDARSPAHLHRIGLIPTGWYPSALAVSADNRYLFVANAKGYGEDRGFQGGPPYTTATDGRILQNDLDSNDIWATLQRIDLRHVDVPKTTLSALRYLRTAAPAAGNALVPPLRSLQASSGIKHVVFILEENKTYDSMLGDLTDAQGNPYGEGDPQLVSFGQTVTPNLHALAREFGLAVNEYADAEESDAGHQYAAAGIASLYTERTLLVKGGRRPLVNKNEDPEDYPRAGYIFNSLQNSGISYRDYGDLVRVSGYDEGSDEDPVKDDPHFGGVADQSAQTSGLGGLFYLDVPAPLALSGHVDLDYPGWNLRIRDVRRAQEFIRDYGALVKAGSEPAFTYVWLPADHGGRGPNIPALPEEVADGDRALGMIVEYLSHLPSWNSMAIFITPDDAQSTRDHIDEHRSYAVVVSPFAKRHYLGRAHISTVSLLKTEEELLGLPALSLGDLLATDMNDYFSDVPDARPYAKIAVPVQTASAEGNRIADLLMQTDQSGPDADAERSAALIGFSRAADRLSAHRDELAPAAYHAEQAALYAQALAVVRR